MCILILLVLVISTRIKYKLTENIYTGNRISSNGMAIKIENEETGEYDNSDVVPTSGYTLNTDSSYCEVNGVKDETVTLEYRDGKVYAKITNSVTNCYVYFNKITDATGPTLTVTTPASTSSSSPTTTSSSSYTVKGTVTDESGVASLTVNGTAVTVGSDGSWSTKVSLTLNSTKTITVIATDSAGNSTTITRYVKRVDTTGPNLTITDDFDTKSGSNTMAGTVSDTSGVESVKVNVYLSDGWSSAGGLTATHTATISGTSWSVTFDLNTSYYVKVEVVATDSLGNTTTIEVYDDCYAYCGW